MSGLPKRKYQKLESSATIEMSDLNNRPVQSVPISDDSTTRIESDSHEPASHITGLRDGDKQLMEPVYSRTSSFDHESEFAEQFSPQFQEVVQRMSSSQSESWFTASSLMDELSVNATDSSNNVGNQATFVAVEMQKQSTSTDKNTFQTEGMGHVAQTRMRRQSKATGINMNQIEIPSPPGRSFVLRPHKSPSAKETSHPDSQTGTTDCGYLNQTSPGKILRTKWKQLFTPRKQSLTDNSLQISRHKQNMIHRSFSHHSTIIEVYDEPVTYACSPRNVRLLKEKQNVIRPPIRTTQSMISATEDMREMAKGNEYTTEPLHSASEKTGQCDPISRRTSSIAELKLKQPAELKARNSANPSLNVQSSRTATGRNVETGQSEPGKYTQQPRVSADQNSDLDSEQKASGVDRLNASHVPDEYKTSFELEEDDPENLLEREAHVGALALAWASGTRKSRRHADGAHSEHGSTAQLRLGNAFRLHPNRRKCETEYVESSRNSMRILAKFHTNDENARGMKSIFKRHSTSTSKNAQNPTPTLDFAIKGPTRTAMTPLGIEGLDHFIHHASVSEHPKSPTDMVSTAPVNLASPTGQQTTDRSIHTVQRPGLHKNTALVHIQSKLFGKTHTGSTRALNVSQSEDEEDKSESVTIELGKDGLPVGQRAQMRRGAQDIPPICATSGRLGSIQQPLLQKNQPRGIGWRLSQRKILNEQRRKIADYSFLFAITGILLMVLELEFLMARVYTRDSFYSLLIKSLISASTFILVCLIVFYHAIDVKLFSVNNCIEDWRIATNPRKLGFVILEVLLCLIHPPPILSNYMWPSDYYHFQSIYDQTAHPDVTFPPPRHTTVESGDSLPATGSSYIPNFNDSIATPFTQVPTLHPITQSTSSHAEQHKSEFISPELSLSIPMFLRLYLIFRVLLLHSTFFTDAGSRSIGALNRVKINVRFILKTIATARPGTMLLIFIMSMWIITSWIMRVCERQQNPEYERMFNTMWLIAVTFLSIGYGDMVPSTHCGRSISVIAGVMGSACTALVVAVVARKLELSRAEKHVHNFMQDNKVYKQLRHSAANVLRETWLFYKHTRLVKRVNAGRVRRHQRKFLQAISRLRKAKDNQRKVKEEANSMVDLAKLQTCVYDTVNHIRNDQAIFVQRLVSVEKCIHQLQMQLSQLPDTINASIGIVPHAQLDAEMEKMDEFLPTTVEFTLDD